MKNIGLKDLQPGFLFERIYIFSEYENNIHQLLKI